VVAATAGGGQGFQYGTGFVLWQRIGWLTLAVVDPSDHDWAIRIAVFEFDNYFLAYAGDRDAAPLGAADRLVHLRPAVGGFVPN